MAKTRQQHPVTTQEIELIDDREYTVEALTDGKGFDKGKAYLVSGNTAKQLIAKGYVKLTENVTD